MNPSFYCINIITDNLVDTQEESVKFERLSARNPWV